MGPPKRLMFVIIFSLIRLCKTFECLIRIAASCPAFVGLLFCFNKFLFSIKKNKNRETTNKSKQQIKVMVCLDTTYC